MNFAFFTLGCKVNLFETQALEQLARARGHEIVTKNADAVIINTCTVTSVSDHKNIRAFHRIRRDHPHAVIAACGCFAQTNPDRIYATGEIDLVCGTADRSSVIDLCEQAVQGAQIEPPSALPLPQEYEPLPAGVPNGRTRALLKIEDGCNNFCTYCIIPYARGRVRSLPVRQAHEECARLSSAGVHEIVLTGIEIASYGRDLQPPVSLTDLLCELLPAFPAVRFRLGSLDPRIISEEFCSRLSAFNNLARHFHLSLQSGCDSVLQRMGRHYTAHEFYQRVNMLRAVWPDASITTDLIVGFPGETEEEFSKTLAFLKQCAFTAVHVFPYSVREGTRAASLPGQLSQKEKAARAERAKTVARQLSEESRRSFIGRTMDALPEHRTGDLWAAHGAYGFPIYIEGAQLHKNEPVLVQLIDLYEDGILAKKI